jgi:hypothetical protein
MIKEKDEKIEFGWLEEIKKNEIIKNIAEKSK